MTDERGPDPSEPLADPVAELEEFIADTERRGEPVPPEARMMLARLRELMSALHGLTASFDERAQPPPSPDAEEEEPRP
ncbi:MAG: hypothetical protein ABR499_22135 [Gemmatimonadaceae bacterium]